MPEPDHRDAVVSCRADQAWHEFQRVVPFRPGDTPRHAIMSLPLDHPHIKHAVLDTTMGYAAIYPEDVITHHRAFIARRRAERPSEEYRELTASEWEDFLAHFELRKVALGVCGRDYGTPCAHENAP